MPETIISLLSHRRWRVWLYSVCPCGGSLVWSCGGGVHIDIYVYKLYGNKWVTARSGKKMRRSSFPLFIQTKEIIELYGSCTPKIIHAWSPKFSSHFELPWKSLNEVAFHFPRGSYLPWRNFNRIFVLVCFKWFMTYMCIYNCVKGITCNCLFHCEVCDVYMHKHFSIIKKNIIIVFSFSHLHICVVLRNNVFIIGANKLNKQIKAMSTSNNSVYVHPLLQKERSAILHTPSSGKYIYRSL